MTDRNTNSQLYDALRVLDKCTRKEVLFDLDTDKLIDLVGKEDAHDAEHLIETDLGRLGYNPFQYSGCTSKRPKSTVEVFLDIEELLRDQPWFYSTCRKCHVSTLLGPMFDLKELHNLKEERRIKNGTEGHEVNIDDLKAPSTPSSL